MSNSWLNEAWLKQETARRYQAFTEQTSMYQELSEELLKLAALQQGQQVLDLGCGTGVTTAAALPHVGPTGHIYALDIAAAMLSLAQQNIKAPQVTFLQGDAANCAQLLVGEQNEPVQLDCVLCNSVFWQFRDKRKVLLELQQLLPPGGRFVFNVPEPYFIFRDIPRSKKVGLLFKQLAAELYGVGQQDLRTMRIFMESHGFEIVTNHTITRDRTAAENLLFLQIPVTTSWMEPPLSYEIRMSLLEEAQTLSEPEERPAKRRWIYFVAERRA